MIKLLKIIFTVLITSFYFFPVDLTFLPTNTKNLLAAAGLVFAVFELIRKQEFFIPKQLLILLLISGMVSLMSLVSVTYNQTPDNTYVSYLVSSIIWLSGAFSVGYIIRLAHGRIDVPLVAHYLIGASLFQCVSAILIEFIPSVRVFVDTYLQGQDLLQKMGRLYGIGAFLDVGGSRFAAVLTTIAFLLVASPKRISIGLTVAYTLSFVVITVIGNMIARTTLIGSLIGLGWIILWPLFTINKNNPERKTRGKAFAILLTLSVLIAVSIILYNGFPEVKELYRFGFEGFFSWAETGEWQTSSTNKLETMVIWPEELRTWIIGDGYFVNSRNDPNYLGDATDQGFYMGTDIGYLRFIYYFGILGLVWIIAVVAYSAIVCADRFEEYAWLFVMALLVGLVVWVKVSTDIFLFFCLFLCAAALRDDPEETELTPETPPNP